MTNLMKMKIYFVIKHYILLKWSCNKLSHLYSTHYVYLNVKSSGVTTFCQRCMSLLHAHTTDITFCNDCGVYATDIVFITPWYAEDSIFDGDTPDSKVHGPRDTTVGIMVSIPPHITTDIIDFYALSAGNRCYWKGSMGLTTWTKKSLTTI